MNDLYAAAPENTMKRIALLHGAGYVGGELIRLLANHPAATLDLVTSRALAGQPAWAAHPTLRHQTDLVFTDPASVQALDLAGYDAVVIAAEHGQGARSVVGLLDHGYEGHVIDLSADFRFKDARLYETWFGFTHPAPSLLGAFTYGLPEVFAPYGDDCRYIANPGCFATAITLALWPLARNLPDLYASVTALTGASGSGARPKETTHYPTREGNVRAYKVLAHQHLPEVRQTLGGTAEVAFVPASGPWTRGIWGTAHVKLPDATDSGNDPAAVAAWFEDAYALKPFIRLWRDGLPELRGVVGTPFCDVGWTVKEGHLVVGFALDNLLKGAASQAVQNLNLLFGLPETAGLLPAAAHQAAPLSL